MYANLKVRTSSEPVPTGRSVAASHDGDEHFVWLIEIDGHRATLHLDANEDGNYAEPAGELLIDLNTTTLRIEADF